MASKKDAKLKAAPNPEARERQLINMAMNVAEKQLKDGTASPSVVVHFLKLGASNAEQEKEILESQAKLYKAKADALEREMEAKDNAEAAINALKSYGSSSND